MGGGASISGDKAIVIQTAFRSCNEECAELLSKVSCCAAVCLLSAQFVFM
jgi:hypothetical protein